MKSCFQQFVKLLTVGLSVVWLTQFLARAEEFLTLPDRDRPGSEIYVIPNETHPYEGRGVYGSASEGVHVSVGSERGWFGLLLDPKATHLLLADMNATVVRYNRLNIHLFKLARDREEYLWLRTKATVDDISRLEKQKFLSALA